jgi:hypothetical protein
MKKADQILTQQKDLQKELEDIQSLCTHDTQSIKQRPDRNEWWWQCRDCSKHVRLTTPDEMHEYLSK